MVQTAAIDCNDSLHLPILECVRAEHLKRVGGSRIHGSVNHEEESKDTHMVVFRAYVRLHISVDCCRYAKQVMCNIAQDPILF